MNRIPLLAGTRVHAVDVGQDGVVLLPPRPLETIADVPAAVRDALRFPLAGEPLEALLGRGARVTIVVEPPALPIPGAARDPRRAAIGAVVGELERLGVPSSAQTILVAGGLARKAGRDELELLVAPTLARRYEGRVDVHDAAGDDLVAVPRLDGTRVHRALVETDAVLTVTAAETVLHGGPAALVAATDAATIRRASADSLLEASGSDGWTLGLALEHALSARAPVLGLSLALGHPQLGGVMTGFPHDRAVVERMAGSRGRRVYGALPGAVRGRILRSLGAELAPVAAFAGPPSVAHAEALLRSVAARAVRLERPLDAVVLGVPHTTPYLPRERPNPLLAATLGLGLALRLWRDAFPVVGGGSAVLVHPFERRFAHPTQAPYRAFFAAARAGRAGDALRAAEPAAAADAYALTAYRAGRACHPLLPFADWDACRPAFARLGTVFAAGCRDAVAARALGLVPVRGINAALEMVGGTTDEPRIGYLVAPPWSPIVVGTPAQ